MAVNLAKGKSLISSALDAARAQLPGGPAAQAAFDAGLALAKGKSIQDAAFAAAGRILPKSPYSADALSFVKQVAAGKNIQQAALSSAGNLVMRRIEQTTGPILSRTTSGITQRMTRPLPLKRGTLREVGEQELTVPPLPRTGRWVRRGNTIIIFEGTSAA
jgi:hypothetical protein